MIEERSAGAVVFRRGAEGMEYLILHYPAGHWDFPKGNIEDNESEEQTVRREVLEETGIEDINLLNGFKKRIQYHYRRGDGLVRKQVVFYVAETQATAVKISKEHLAYSWEGFARAIKTVTYTNAKQVLESAHTFIEKIITKRPAQLDAYAIQAGKDPES